MSENFAHRSRILGLVDLGSGRHLDVEVASGSAGFIGPFAMSTPLCRVDRAVAEVVEGVQSFVSDQDDGSTVAAISA
jgi:hypothetical protein